MVPSGSAPFMYIQKDVAWSILSILTETRWSCRSRSISAVPQKGRLGGDRPGVHMYRYRYLKAAAQDKAKNDIRGEYR